MAVCGDCLEVCEVSGKCMEIVLKCVEIVWKGV